MNWTFKETFRAWASLLRKDKEGVQGPNINGIPFGSIPTYYPVDVEGASNYPVNYGPNAVGAGSHVRLPTHPELIQPTEFSFVRIPPGPAKP